MRERQGSVLETLRRVQGFLDTNGAVLGGINASGSRKALDDSIAQLTTSAVEQSAGQVASKGETGRKAALRLTLRQQYMKPIATIARAQLRDVPEFRALQLPNPRLSTEKLVAAAGAMAEAANKHAQVFVDAGLPQDFATQLTTAASAVTGSVDSRGSSRNRRVKATSDLQSHEKRARNLIRVLDSLVVPALGTNDGLVSAWKSAKRVSAKPGVPIGQSAGSSGSSGTTGSPSSTSSGSTTSSSSTPAATSSTSSTPATSTSGGSTPAATQPAPEAATPAA